MCDNTRELALAEEEQQYKVKHTRRSAAQLVPARAALVLVHTRAEDFADEVKGLCSTTVTDRQWAAFLDAHVPITDQQLQPLAGRTLTAATKKRSKLPHLYRHDDRVCP